MGWSGSLSASSDLGSSITFTPDTSSWHEYTVGTFTSPKNGVYRFALNGGGYRSGEGSRSAGGEGGMTTGYLMMEAGETVYIGAGGPCSAAFVSGATGSALKNIAKENLYFVAGAGGGGGARWGEQYNMKSGPGGKGGGTSGETAGNGYGTGNGSGIGGTQTSGYAYGEGQGGSYGNDGASYHPGDGGDGYYGGRCGAFAGGLAQGGGGGSGYIYTGSINIGGTTYTNSTQQGGGSGNNARGSVEVTYYALGTIPIIFNGTQLTKIIYNGTAIDHLIYNGTELF